VLAGMQQDPLHRPLAHPGCDAGSAGGQIGGPLQPFDREDVGFGDGRQGLPGPALGGRVHKAAHQQSFAPMRCPEQLQAGHGRALADRVAHGHQPFGGREVIGLVGEGETMPIQALLDRDQGQAPPLQPQAGEQLRQGDTELHRHRLPAVQHHRQSFSRQGQGQQRQQRRRAIAAVVGHSKAEGPASRGLEAWSQVAVSVQHPGQLLRRGTSDAMGDQERPHLGPLHLAAQHQRHGLVGLRPTQTGAGVLAATHLADEVPKAGPGLPQGRASLAAAVKRWPFRGVV
jgi:hypothetical protein